jgi:hypothetical protein
VGTWCDDRLFPWNAVDTDIEETADRHPEERREDTKQYEIKKKFIHHIVHAPQNASLFPETRRQKSEVRI